MKNMTIRTKLILIIVFTIISVATMIAIKSIHSLNSLTKENIADYRKTAYNVEEETLASYTNFAKKYS